MKTQLYALISNYVYAHYNKREQHAIITELTQVIDPKYLVKSKQHIDLPNHESIQRKLSVINEKESIRKKKGVYYTPLDLVNFLISNTIKEMYGILTPDNLGDPSLDAIDGKDFCFNKTCFDPTCGTGEFLINTLILKYDLAERQLATLSKAKIHNIANTIYGNDINPDSILIVKLRIFLLLLDRFGVSAINGIFKQIHANYSNDDFVSKAPHSEYDLLLGNPPFVEDSKYHGVLKTRFGNIYANVLVNAAQSLHKNGAFGFVIPISYISTPRMKKIREVLLQMMPNQYILSYADRPDCIFSGVHQKLCIVIARKSATLSIHTSQYHYWYKHERPELFNTTKAIKNSHQHPKYIPKLGNSIDISLYETVLAHDVTSDSFSLKHLLTGGQIPVYLNMRATFWIKAFLTEHEGGEYKKYGCKTHADASLALCLLNSSLFWWHWVCVSDCWHITNKELESFNVPMTLTQADYAKCINLAKVLEDKLEATKKFVGTKQTSYEYKHKLCVHEIHEIDDVIASIYNLSKAESEYVKSFAYKYRVGEVVLHAGH